LFSTHYHMLMAEFANDPRIAMFHMACTVEKENVTFLYKFTKGVCPKSYGMNVAKLAGLPESVVRRAGEMSESFERHLKVAHRVEKEEKDGQRVLLLRRIQQAIQQRDISLLIRLQHQFKQAEQVEQTELDTQQTLEPQEQPLGGSIVNSEFE